MSSPTSPRRSRRIQQEDPEYEAAPASQRVTPPRTSAEGGPSVPFLGSPDQGSTETYATAPHTLGDALSDFVFVRGDDEDSISSGEQTLSDHVLEPTTDEERRLGLANAAGILARAQNNATMPNENGDPTPEEVAVAKARRLQEAVAGKTEVWRDQLMQDLGELRSYVATVEADQGDEVTRERLKESYLKAHSRREALLAERYKWESLLFESEYTADELRAKTQEIAKLYDDIDKYCRGNLLEKAKELSKNGINAADSKLFKLPTVAVPGFKGEISEFPSFERAFESVIGKSQLPAQYKLVHLKAAIKGEPTKLASVVGSDAADYQKLWNLLRLRYGDASSLRAQVMADFMNLPKQIPTGAEAMRKAHDNVVAKLNRLKEVDPRAASREEWIMLVMEPLYSRDLRRRIREKLATETPSVADFLETAEEFISREVRMSHADRVNPLNGNGNGKKSADGGKEAGKGGKGGPKKTGTTAGFAVTVAEAEAKVAACAATKPQNSSRTKSGGGKGRKKSFSSIPQNFK